MYLGVKLSKVLREQVGTKPAKVGRLASTLLKYVGSAQRSTKTFPPSPLPPHPQVFAPVGGPKLLKWGLSG